MSTYDDMMGYLGYGPSGATQNSNLADIIARQEQGRYDQAGAERDAYMDYLGKYDEAMAAKAAAGGGGSGAAGKAAEAARALNQQRKARGQVKKGYKTAIDAYSPFADIAKEMMPEMQEQWKKGNAMSDSMGAAINNPAAMARLAGPKPFDMKLPSYLAGGAAGTPAAPAAPGQDPMTGTPTPGSMPDLKFPGNRMMQKAPGEMKPEWIQKLMGGGGMGGFGGKLAGAAGGGAGAANETLQDMFGAAGGNLQNAMYQKPGAAMGAGGWGAAQPTDEQKKKALENWGG